jgi:HAD superfamily hydrolase (TIGR01509 family)
MYKHILFDNDGTIVDTEILAMRAMLNALRPFGLTMDEPTYAKTFPGYREHEIIALLQRDHGLPEIPATFYPERKAASKALFDRELKAVPGMDILFNEVIVPKSMVSNGSSEHVVRCLERVGLSDSYNGRIFGVDLVEKGKPAPDLYLLAMRELGLQPHEVIAVEDSIAGIQAAKAAGVTVVGFLGAGHITDNHDQQLLRFGADHLATDAQALRHLFAQWRLM